MKIVYMERGTGKTKKLIEEALLHNYAIIIATEVQKDYINGLCEKYHYGKPVVYSISDLKIRKNIGKRYNGYVVDNAELVLEILLGLDTSVKMISITKESETNKTVMGLPAHLVDTPIGSYRSNYDE